MSRAMRLGQVSDQDREKKDPGLSRDAKGACLFRRVGRPAAATAVVAARGGAILPEGK
jgi:hypothetical protein